ncbi:MAG: MCP four helix bundle domain-containing protein [Proteobacteria bacterium]|nr:MCP four helix bundle domain-containing protein [Pseudomonadota bacterium]
MFKNMKLGTKLILGFSVVAVITLMMGILGYYGAVKSGQAVEEIGLVRLPGVDSLLVIRKSAENIRGSVSTLIIQGMPDEIHMQQYDNLTKAHEEYEKAWKIYEPLPRTPEEAEICKQFVQAWNAWRDENNKFIELSKQIDANIASGTIDMSGNAALLDMSLRREKEKAAIALLDKLVQINRDAATDAAKKANAEANFMRVFSLTVMLIGVVLSMALGIFLTRSIVGPIRRIIEGLNEGAEQVASASGQVSSSSQSLAEGASEQAAGIEETSSSIEEMSSMTKQNAANAGQANSLMGEANKMVGIANQSMGSLTESMKEIAKASEETSKIIKTIDEIAFQTNLLALNAAVEAARAGEAGAGFAVVADEVRNLAMRAADAAKNTANLIEGTVKKVKDGSELVAKTNQAFSEVAGSATKVGQLVGEISAASNEQSQGIDQINKAVAEMDKVVQQNAANAEESASASEEMNAQAQEMKGFVEELIALVGSNNKSNGKNHDKPARHTLSGRTHKPAARIALKNKKAGSFASKEVDPKKLIPMGDEEFKDF